MADWWGNNANTGGGGGNGGSSWWSGGTPNNSGAPWWNNGVPTSGLGNDPGGAVPRNTYNAKNMPFDQPGVGAENSGINLDNLDMRFGRLFENRGNKAGGSRQAWETLTNWASPEKIRARGGDPNDTQWQLVNEAIRTGRLDPQLNRNTLLRGVDFAIRENSRAQQHKPQNFFTNYLLDPLVMGGLSLIPGVGPYAAMAYGGIKGGVEDGFLSAATGLLSGFGATQFTNWMRNGMTAGFGALNNVNTFMPADIAARAGTTALPQTWALGPGGRLVRRGASAAASTLRNRGRRPQPGPRP